ncbi:MAG: single-stranded DNA-binding protein [Acidithiobacillus ferriphilus]
MPQLTLQVQVFPFDDSRGLRAGVSIKGKPYEFFEQQAVADGGANRPPVVFRVQHNKRSDVLAPGFYHADLALFSDRFGVLMVRLEHFRPAQGKPQAVAG